jgi:SAM-dependent methyltransferase
MSIDALCPIASIASLHGDRTARLNKSAGDAGEPAGFVAQVLKSAHDDAAFFVWQRHLSSTSGTLVGPLSEMAALAQFDAAQLAAKASGFDVAASEGVGAQVLFPVQPLSSARRQRAFNAVPIDDVRRFWDERPCNLKHGTAPIGTKEYFDQVEARKYRVEPHIPRFADFERWRGCDVLEVGCGLGTESVNFARHGARLTAVDLSERSAELTRQRLAVQGVSGDVLVADAETLSQTLAARHGGAAPQFDLAWSFGVLHHTPSPGAAIAQLAQLVKRGGELRIMVYAKVSYKLFFLMRETGVWDFARIDELLGEYSEAQSGCPVTYSYTEDEVRSTLLPASDWEVLSVEKDHIFAYSIPEYRQHQYVRERCWANVSDDDFHKLERELGWHLLVRAKRR